MAAKRQSPSVRQKETEAMAAKRQSPSVRQKEAEASVRDTNRERGKEAKGCHIKETVVHQNVYIQLLILYLLYRKRASLDDDARENQRQEERIAQKQRIGQSSTLLEASQAFISAIKEGPDYVCVCCNRLMYRKTVQQFKGLNYDKAPSEFVMPKCTSTQDKQRICKTCHSALKRGEYYLLRPKQII